MLLRYVLGDVVTLERGPCEACGRAGERMVAHHGRGDTRVKVRGQLVDLAAVSDLIGLQRDVAEHAIQMVPADPDETSTMDILRVVIAVSDHADADQVAARISQLIHASFSVRPEVQLADRDAIYSIDDTMKPARVRIER